jgi:hypothetical protein
MTRPPQESKDVPPGKSTLVDTRLAIPMPPGAVKPRRPFVIRVRPSGADVFPWWKPHGGTHLDAFMLAIFLSGLVHVITTVLTGRPP